MAHRRGALRGALKAWSAGALRCIAAGVACYRSVPGRRVGRAAAGGHACKARIGRRVAAANLSALRQRARGARIRVDGCNEHRYNYNKGSGDE